MVSQKIILKLEVHPSNGAPYIAEDRFMAKSMDVMRLNEGCDVQVSVARNHPKWVVCLPETVTASPNAPVQARASLAMADFAEQVSRGGSTDPQQVMEALRARGVRTSTLAAPDDPKAKLEKLKEMLTEGLITQKEYEAKKAEILSKF